MLCLCFDWFRGFIPEWHWVDFSLGCFFFLMCVCFCFYREEEKKVSRFACLHFLFCPCQSGIHSARVKAGIYFKSLAYGFRYWGFGVEVLFFSDRIDRDINPEAL